MFEISPEALEEEERKKKAFGSFARIRLMYAERERAAFVSELYHFT